MILERASFMHEHRAQSPVWRARAVWASLTVGLAVGALIEAQTSAGSKAWRVTRQALEPAQAHAQEVRQAKPQERGPVRMVNKNLPDIADVFEEQKPKVVAVKTEQARQAAIKSPLSGPNSPRVGQGSGFIVDAQGYIITNYHVVAGASGIEVSLATGKKYPAKLVGSDEKTDIALLKINPEGPLPAVTLGSSEAARVGEWVVAIGSPFGLEHSVTAGILSAKGRNLGQGPYDDFLQTDASINPGNSGGPLFNLYGEVIGVNTAIIRDAQGIGFAVPVDLVRSILPSLKERGYVVRGYIGAGIQELTEELARSLNLQARQGVLVGSLTTGGPAALAKLQVGDVITTFNGRRVTTVQELLLAVAQTPPGASVPLEYLRQGQQQTTQLTIVERPDSRRPEAQSSNQAPQPQERRASADPRERLGVEVTEVDPELAAQLNLKERGGAYVRAVTPGSPAASALRPGDVILQINQYKIGQAADLSKVLGTIGAERAVRVLVWRGGRTVFLALRP